MEKKRRSDDLGAVYAQAPFLCIYSSTITLHVMYKYRYGQCSIFSNQHVLQKRVVYKEIIVE